MNVNKIAKSIALASLVAASGTALAATDGTLGATSTGTTDITMQVDDAVMITGLEDMPLGAYTGTAALTGATAFCVYRNGTGNYDVTLTSANSTTTAFQAVNVDGDVVPYTVIYNDAPIPVGGTALASGVISPAPFVGNGASRTCGGADNASLQVTFAQTVLDAAPTGSYSDTLTVLIAPN